MAGALYGHLAGASGDDILVTRRAALGIIDRAKAVIEGFNLFVDEPGLIVRAQRLYVIFVDRVKVGPLGKEAVGSAIETGFTWQGCCAGVGSTSDAFDVKEFRWTFGPSRTLGREYLLARFLGDRLGLSRGSANCRDSDQRRQWDRANDECF